MRSIGVFFLRLNRRLKPSGDPSYIRLISYPEQQSREHVWVRLKSEMLDVIDETEQLTALKGKQ